MASFEFCETAIIPAPPPRVYSIIADYVHGHPSILPKKTFSNLRVESGGYGAGTRIDFEMRLLGRTHSVRAEITEPQPGHVLVETYPDTGTVTTFTVKPDGGGSGSRVTFHTRITVSGFAGWVQRWLVPRLFQPVYQEELRNLARVAQSPGEDQTTR